MGTEISNWGRQDDNIILTICESIKSLPLAVKFEAAGHL
jgi:hypothetical protein